MKNKKHELNFIPFYDIPGMNRHLEDMALKGWFLEKITDTFLHYRKDTPKKMHYSVSYDAKASVFEPEPREDQLTFMDFCEYSGWKLVSSNAKIMVFSSEAEDPVPIYTDPESEIRAIRKVGKQNMVMNLVALVICTFSLISSVRRILEHPTSALTDTFSMTLSLSLLLLIIEFVFFEVLRYFVWRRKATAAAEAGEFFVLTFSGIQPFKYVLGLLLFFMIAAGITSSQKAGFLIVFLHFILLLFLICILKKLRDLLKARKVSRENNIGIIVAADIILAMALTGFLFWLSSRLIKNDAPESLDPEETLITAEMLDDEEDERYQYFSNQESSILLSYTSAGHNMPYDVETDLPDFYYEIAETRFDWVMKLCFDQFFHRYDAYGSYEDDYDPEDPFYKYTESDPAPWNAEKAWQLSIEGELQPEYLLFYDGRLVHVEYELPFTEENMKLCGDIFAAE